MRIKLSLAACVAALILFSCQKELRLPSPPQPNDELPSTPEGKARVELNKELASIFFEIYKNPKAFHEVNAAIYSEYYDDESVMLKDLLYPESSLLYKQESFVKLKPYIGSFKQEFYSQLDNADYPSIKAALGRANPTTSRIVASAPDTAMEIFSKANGVAIYFPYSENFQVPLTTAYFDGVNHSPNGLFATIVAADRDADTGPGTTYYRCGRAPNFTVCSKAVTVDDAYAELHPTHIIGVIAEPARVNDDPPPVPTFVVFIGEVRCTKQFDRLISFTGNGGGSELAFTRGDIYLLPTTTGQITNFQDLVSAKFKRKPIRKGTWKNVFQIWDSNWEVANTNQILGIFEDDNTGTKTFTGSLSSTLTSSGTPPIPVTGTLGFSIVVQTQDEIIRQLNWNRTSFYTYNHGGLNNGCGTRSGWTVYDCNASTVAYTMPTQ